MDYLCLKMFGTMSDRSAKVRIHRKPKPGKILKRVRNLTLYAWYMKMINQNGDKTDLAKQLYILLKLIFH